MDHEKGIAWRALADLDWTCSGKAFPKLSGGFDYGVPLPIPNSSAWIYASGRHLGQAASPARSILFRFVPQTITSMSGPRNGTAKLESFPGFEIDEIAARRFAKVTGEINFPPVRFAEVGTPAFYLSHFARPLFAGAMATQAPEGVASLLRCRRPSSTWPSPSRCACHDFLVGAAGGWRDGHIARPSSSPR